jgi:hypothetical protein
VEPRHELAFPGTQWSFVAYLDLVTAKGTIVDLKVKAKHLGDAEARRDPQPRAYVLARRLDEAGRDGGPPPRRFVFHSLRHGRNPEALAVPDGGFLPSDLELQAFQARLILTRPPDRRLPCQRRLGLRVAHGMVVLGALCALTRLSGRGRRRHAAFDRRLTAQPPRFTWMSAAAPAGWHESIGPRPPRPARGDRGVPKWLQTKGMA